MFITNSPENLGNYYANDYASRTLDEDIPFLNWKVRFIKDRMPPDGNYLELGPGSGNLCRKLHHLGYSVSAIEMSQNACEFLSKDGINVIHSSDIIESLHSLPLQDCIASIHNLEHLSNPIAVLQAVIEKLKPYGVIIAEMPNPASFEAELYQQYWYHLDAPRHQTLITYETFSEIAKNLGLEEVEILWDTPHGKINDVAAWIHSFQHWCNVEINNRSWRSDLRYKIVKHKIVKHAINDGLRLLRWWMQKATKRKYPQLSNSYTVVLRKNEPEFPGNFSPRATQPEEQ